MDIDRALTRLANAPLEQVDLSQIEAGVMRGIAQTATLIRLQTPVRYAAMLAALVVGTSLGGITTASDQAKNSLVSGAHLAPSTLLGPLS